MPTRRTVMAGLAAAPLAAGLAGHITNALAQDALSGDTLSTSAGDVIIHPVSHASLLLGFGDNVLYVDPVGADAFKGLPAATAILITHQHGDHFDVPTLQALPAVPIMTTKTVADGLPEDMKARALVVADNGSGELGGIPITAIPAYNTTADRQQYHPKGVGNGYILTFGDKKVYVAGDTEDTPEMRALADIAVAFLPMNLPYTMTEEQAADAVKAFKPAVVYPYHYRGSDTQKFAELVGDASEVRLREWYPAGSAA